MERTILMSRIILWFLVIFVSARAPIAEAQQSAKIPRIGFVTATPLASIAARIEAFRQGLRDVGYVEGKIS